MFSPNAEMFPYLQELLQTWQHMAWGQRARHVFSEHRHVPICMLIVSECKHSHATHLLKIYYNATASVAFRRQCSRTGRIGNFKMQARALLPSACKLAELCQNFESPQPTPTGSPGAPIPAVPPLGVGFRRSAGGASPTVSAGATHCPSRSTLQGCAPGV